MANKLLDELSKRRAQLQDAPENTPERELARVDDEIAKAKQEQQAAAEQVRAKKLLELHAREWELMEPIRKGVEALLKTYEPILQLHDEIRLLGGSPEAPFAPALLNQLTATLDWWKKYTPQVLGLPPLPSYAEQRRAEHKDELERTIRDLGRLIDDTQQIRFGSEPNDYARGALEGWKIRREQAREELAALSK